MNPVGWIGWKGIARTHLASYVGGVTYSGKAMCGASIPECWVPSDEDRCQRCQARIKRIVENMGSGSGAGTY